MKYDNKSGISIKATYPDKGVNLTDATLMNIFSLHEFSQEDGITSLTVGEINVVSYYSGEKLDYYVILVLALNETPEDYEQKLRDISKNILANLDEEEYIDMLPSLFSQISKIT